MKRRIISFLCAAALLICNMMLFASVAFAEGSVTNWSVGGDSAAPKEYPKGYWKLVSVVNKGPSSQFDNATMSGGNGHYSCSAKCIDDRISAYHDGEHLTSCVGESATITIDVTEPPAIIKPGEEVTLTVSPDFTASTPHDSLMFYTCQVHVGYGYGGYNADGKFKDSNGKEYLGIDRTWQYDDYYGAAGLGNYFIKIESDNILRNTFERSSSKMWICITFAHGRGEDAIDTYYCYEWIPDREPPADGKEEETDGYWELTETEIPEQAEYTPSYIPSAKTVTKFSDGEVTAKFTATEDYKTEDGEQKLLKGDTVGASLVYTKPKTRYKPFEKIELEVSAASDLVTRSGSLYDLFLGIEADCYANAGYMYERDSGMSFGKRSTRYLTDVANKTIGSSFREPVFQGTLTGIVPDKDPDDEPDKASMWIYVNIDDSDSTSGLSVSRGSIIYKYKWVSGKMPAGSGTEKDGGGNGGSKTPEQTIFQLVETNADERPGEDDGHRVIPAIVIGISTLGAAAGAGAAASSGSKKKKEDDTTYRMYIRKDFGDTIKKAAKPVRVYARIASSGGSSANDSVLSSQIMIYTETQGVSVTTLGLVSGAQCAEIEIPNPNTDISECVIVFRYRGKGGVFTEKVKFKVMGVPFIEFVEVFEPESPYNKMVKPICRDEMDKELVIGDTKPLNIYIRLSNFLGDADSITPAYPAGCNTTVDFRRLEDFLYRVELKDSTTEKPPLVGKYPIEHDITFTATHALNNTEKEEAQGILKIKLYPEGIFVCADTLRPEQIHNEENYIDIYTNDFSGGKGPYGNTSPVSDPGKAYADMLKETLLKVGITNRELRFKEEVIHVYPAYSSWAPMDEFSNEDFGDIFITTAGTPDSVLKKFKFRLKYDREKETTILKPDNTVILKSKDEMLMLAMLFRPLGEPERKEELIYRLPLRLVGEDGTHQKQAREKEINAISRLIYAMQLGEVEPAMELLKNMRGRYVTATELTLTRYAMYDIGVRYWHDVSVGAVKTAEFYTPVIWTVTTVKYIANTAFSYIIIGYCKAKGWPDEFIEPFASGFLNMVEDYFADVSMDYFWGIDIEDHPLLSGKRWKDMFWGSLDSMVFGAFVSPNIETFNLKKVILALSIASGVNFYKNLRDSKDEETGKYDLYKALAATVASVSIQTLQIVLFKRILPWAKKGIGDSKTGKAVGKWASDVGSKIAGAGRKAVVKITGTVTNNKYAGPIVKKFVEFVQNDYTKFIARYELGEKSIDGIKKAVEDNAVWEKLTGDAISECADMYDDNIQDFYKTGLPDAFGSFGYFDIEVADDEGNIHTVQVSWAASLCAFIDFHLRTLGFHQANNMDFSSALPKNIPYVSNEQVVEALRSAQMINEAEYVNLWEKAKKGSGITVSDEAFLPQAETPTFDMGTDFHKYVK